MSKLSDLLPLLTHRCFPIETKSRLYCFISHSFLIHGVEIRPGKEDNVIRQEK